MNRILKAKRDSFDYNRKGNKPIVSCQYVIAETDTFRASGSLGSRRL